MSISGVGSYSLISDFYQNRTDNNPEKQEVFKKAEKEISVPDKVEISREGLEKSRGTVVALSQADIEARSKVVELTDNSLIFNTRADILKGI